MPVLSDAEYVRLVDTFLSHWAQVNVAVGTSPLILREGYALARLKADRDALAQAVP
jgi:hypothetical protein